MFICNDIHVCHGMSSGNKNENSNGLRVETVVDMNNYKMFDIKKIVSHHIAPQMYLPDQLTTNSSLSLH